MRAMAIVACLLAAGCSGSKPWSVLAATRPAGPTTLPATRPADDLEFAEMIPTLALPTIDDGLRAVLILVDGECKPLTFEARLAECRQRGLTAVRWKFRADDALDRGTLAYMICRACRIKGGLNWHLFRNRRYALREAVYRGLMDEGPGYQRVTGPELEAILNRAIRYISRHGLRPGAAGASTPPPL